MPHTDVALSAERWTYLKSLRVIPRLFWKSTEEYGHRRGQGQTYNVGMSKRKEVAYALKMENRKRLKQAKEKCQ